MQFRTKARAVDLLGKGQIADLPTAITELWKNGYDAYAGELQAKIFLEGYKGLESPMFVITDDGKGMSKQEILDNWLVLGTDSKSRNKLEDKESEETLWKKPRIKSGEKGIGRLSVAFLGSPMLMLTKKRGHNLQALFFDWRLLENYNLFLDAIEIPVEEIESTSDFKTKFEKLKKTFLKNFEEKKDTKEEKLIWESSQKKLKDNIVQSISNIKIPDFFNEEILNDLLSFTNENGTKFIIFEPIEQIINLTKNEEDKINDNEFVISSLSGFTNEFKKKKNAKIKTSVPIHSPDNGIYDLLNSKGNFFGFKDYDLADIIIDGEFDGEGSFKGILTVFDEDFSYSFTNSRKKDLKTNYGKFKIKLGYSLGSESESKLEKNIYGNLKTKLNQYGGLYLYRDDFRVLPYGRSNVDFLDFEKRRSLRAGTYFFSLRRMFGYIGLTRSNNSDLKDKSSREGLINNSYFRAFRSDLIQFFIELAQTYFSDKAKDSLFIDKKEELKEQKEELKKDKERERKEKIAFSKNLKKYPKAFENYQNEYQELISNLAKKIESPNIIYSEIEESLEDIQSLDIEFKNLLPKITKRYKPTETQLDILFKYEEELNSFNKTIKKESRAVLKKVKSRLAVQELRKEFEKRYLNFGGVLEKEINATKEILNEKFKTILLEYNEKAKRIKDDLDFEKNLISKNIESKEDVIEGIDKISDKFEFLREQFERELVPIVEHIKRLDFDIDEELIQGAYKAEYDAIKFQWEQTRDMAQLGIAVEIIDHEFNQLYAKIKNSINKLNSNNEVKHLSDFDFLKKHFSQLEDKYSLLSPLYRISGVYARDIKCQSIYDYLTRFFQLKIQEEEIEFIATTNFKNQIINIKEPIVHTVFVNLINNAIYWLRNSKVKKIELDYFSKTNEILILNSGTKIENHKIEKIFELFYSNRPNGRGIGLFLSKQSLNENHFDIYATNDKKYNKLNGACFVIKPIK